MARAFDPAALSSAATVLPNLTVGWSSTNKRWELYLSSGGTWGALSPYYNININGTVGETAQYAGAFTTLTASGSCTFGDASTDVHVFNGKVGFGRTPTTHRVEIDVLATLGVMRLYDSLGNAVDYGIASGDAIIRTGAGVERMRVQGDGRVAIGTATPMAGAGLTVQDLIHGKASIRTDSCYTAAFSVSNSNTSTTMTAATLISGIRTGTPAANITYTLPTGTNMDAVFESLQANHGIEWTLINLAAATYAITVAVNTGHTVVGNMVVAANTSARFITRKTAANTFVTYRAS